MENKPIKIIITDDHSLFRRGVRQGLSQKENIEIIGESGNGQELLDQLTYLEPDMVIMGVQMPVMDGVTAMPIIREMYPRLKVIILSMHNDPSVICKMLELGANTYLTKEASSASVYEAVMGCQQNWLYINQSVWKAISNYRKFLPREKEPLEFSEKEKVLLYCLERRETLDAIGRELGVHVKTIEEMIDKLRKKTGLSRLAEILEFARRGEGENSG